MKRILSLFLISLMLFSLPMTVAAEEPTVNNEAEDAANKLHQLGLFNGVGTNPDGAPVFELHREPTRYEAIVMLVRLLGKEKEALSQNWETPFSDVEEWARPYVGCAYTKGLTQGVSPTEFGGEDLVSASQYLTFVLRALGYKDGVDFVWDRSYELSDRLGITDGEYCDNPNSFLRADIAVISVDAIEQPIKGENKILKDHIKEELDKFDKDAEQNLNNAPVVSEPDFTLKVAAYINGFCCYANTYVTSESTFKIEMITIDNHRCEVESASVLDESICDAKLESDGTVTVTKKKNGNTDVKIYFKLYESKSPSSTPQQGPDLGNSERLVMDTRTDVGVNFGPLPTVSGLSLQWHGKIYYGHNSNFGLNKSEHPIYVSTVLFNGKPIKDYTVTSNDENAQVTVQADGSLLVEMGSSRKVYFTVKYGNYSASFCANN